jgi:hypothetical protein
MVLVAGARGVLAATGYLRVVIRDEPILALLGALFLWGLIRFLPGYEAYGIDAVREIRTWTGSAGVAPEMTGTGTPTWRTAYFPGCSGTSGNRARAVAWRPAGESQVTSG